MKNNIREIIIGSIIGLILGGGGTYIIQLERFAKLEAQVEQLKQQSPSADSKTEKYVQNTAVKAEELIEVITEQQAFYVKKSWGTEAYQSFTNDDFNKFQQSRSIDRMINALKKNNHFLDVVVSIKSLPPSEWQKIKTICLNTFKPTFSEQGAINEKGQTEVGQKAEKMIAESIVKLVVELLKMDKEEFEKLYVL